MTDHKTVTVRDVVVWYLEAHKDKYDGLCCDRVSWCGEGVSCVCEPRNLPHRCSDMASCVFCHRGPTGRMVPGPRSEAEKLTCGDCDRHDIKHGVDRCTARDSSKSAACFMFEPREKPADPPAPKLVQCRRTTCGIKGCPHSERHERRPGCSVTSEDSCGHVCAEVSDAKG